MSDAPASLAAITKASRAATLLACRSDSCIASTRILTGVLDYFGYSSEPLPCSAAIWNSAGFAASEAHLEVSEWPPEAHSVGVAGTGRVSETGRWDGHLVAMVEGRWLIDPSADQFARPHRNIVVGGPLVFDALAWVDRTRLNCWLRSDGLVFGYQLMPNPGPWRASPDWRSGRYREVVGDVIRELRPALSRPSSGQVATS